jgi:hypothetical protein
MMSNQGWTTMRGECAAVIAHPALDGLSSPTASDMSIRWHEALQLF